MGRAYREREDLVVSALRGASIEDAECLVRFAVKEFKKMRTIECREKIRDFRIGQKVRFTSRKRGGTIVIEVQKLTGKNVVGVQTSPEQARPVTWRVAASLCEAA